MNRPIFTKHFVALLFSLTLITSASYLSHLLWPSVNTGTPTLPYHTEIYESRRQDEEHLEPLISLFSQPGISANLPCVQSVSTPNTTKPIALNNQQDILAFTGESPSLWLNVMLFAVTIPLSINHRHKRRRRCLTGNNGANLQYKFVVQQ